MNEILDILGHKYNLSILQEPLGDYLLVSISDLNGKKATHGFSKIEAEMGIHDMLIETILGLIIVIEGAN